MGLCLGKRFRSPFWRYHRFLCGHMRAAGPCVRRRRFTFGQWCRLEDRIERDRKPRDSDGFPSRDRRNPQTTWGHVVADGCDGRRSDRIYGGGGGGCRRMGMVYGAYAHHDGFHVHCKCDDGRRDGRHGRWSQRGVVERRSRGVRWRKKGAMTGDRVRLGRGSGILAQRIGGRPHLFPGLPGGGNGWVRSPLYIYWMIFWRIALATASARLDARNFLSIVPTYSDTVYSLRWSC